MNTFNIPGQPTFQSGNFFFKKRDSSKSIAFHSNNQRVTQSITEIPTKSQDNIPFSCRKIDSFEHSYTRIKDKLQHNQERDDHIKENENFNITITPSQFHLKNKLINSSDCNPPGSLKMLSVQELQLPQGKRVTIPFKPSSILESIGQAQQNILSNQSPNQNKYLLRQSASFKRVLNENTEDQKQIPSNNLQNIHQSLYSSTQPVNFPNSTSTSFNRCVPLPPHPSEKLRTLNTCIKQNQNSSFSQKDCLSIMTFKSARIKPLSDTTNFVKNVFSQDSSNSQIKTMNKFTELYLKDHSNVDMNSDQKINTSNCSFILRSQCKQRNYLKVAEFEEDKRTFEELVSLSPTPQPKTKQAIEQSELISLNQQKLFSKNEKFTQKRNQSLNFLLEVANEFSENYKKISHIQDEANHFKEEMKVSQKMLTATLTQNILPRKLGILSQKQNGINSKSNLQKTASNHKKQKAIHSFQAINSMSDKQDTFKSYDCSIERNLLIMAGQEEKKAKAIDEQSFNINNKLFSILETNQVAPINETNYKVLRKRSSVFFSNPQLQENEGVIDNPINKIAEKEKDLNSQYDGKQFKDSDEVAAYLKANYLSKKEKKNLNLSHLHIAKTYSNMLCQALSHSHFQHLNSLNLMGNNLGGLAIELLSQNLPIQIKKLDISSNFLTFKDADSLNYILNHKNYRSLIYINLSNNFLSDTGMKAISEQLAKNSYLESVSLGKNKLSDQIGAVLKDILMKNSSIQELYLNWNTIGSKAGVQIAEGLNDNFNIKVLDLSHNCLGQNKLLKCGKKIIESCSRIESGVIHLDLSYNMFQKAECHEVASSLQPNKKLMGFHFEGNELHAIVDSRGFLYFPNESQILQKHVSTHTLLSRSINSVKCLGLNKLQNFNCNATDNCWICDGWQEVEFELKDGCNDQFLGDPAFLHLDFEDFKPIYMDRDLKDNSRFILRRMCPPNRKIQFFFSNPCLQAIFYSIYYPNMQNNLSEQNKSTKDEMIILNNVSTQEDEKKILGDQKISESTDMQESKQNKLSLKYLDSTVQEYIVPTVVNWVETKLHTNVHKKRGEYEKQTETLIRQEETFFKINYTNQWHRGISLFKSYTPDTAEIDEKCFQEDWNNTSLPQLLNNFDKNCSVDDCKKLLLGIFPQLRVVYRYLSCLQVSNEVFCMNFNSLALFAHQSKIIDGFFLKMRDLECLFIATSSKALKTKNYRQPEKALTRYEFLEVFSRLALDKYIRNKITKSAQEAIKMFISNKTLIAHLSDYEEPQKWREIRYWTKGCDDVLKKYLNFIRNIWNEYADSRKSEKRIITYNFIKRMSLNEFSDMVDEFQIKDKLLGDREVNMSFNFALMTIVDEQTSDRFMSMSFVEFLESLARLAEFKSRAPLGEREESYLISEREEICLQYKLESLLEDMSVKYDQVIKEKKKMFMLSQSSQKIRSNQKLPALKSRKSYSQFSRILDSKEEIESVNQNSASFISKIGGNSSQSFESIAKYSDSKLSTTFELPKKVSRFLDRIDSLNDELDEEDDSKKQKNQEKVDDKQKIISLVHLEEN